MHIDPARHSNADNYKLLTNLVVPRPIAWISTLSPSGIVNLAPFSFFNAVGSDPLYVIFSAGLNDAGEPKDTAKNIRASGEFVVNLVTEDLFQAMNISAVFIGEVVMFHVDDQLIDERMHIHDFAPIGRLGSPSVYCTTTDRFDAPRISYAQWLESQK
jgi:flavin reductase (DIM6/NTAB) family NADH-FMN oxidoreductase RutF